MINNQSYQLDIFLHGQPREQAAEYVDCLHGQSPCFALISTINKKFQKFKEVDWVLGKDLKGWVQTYGDVLSQNTYITMSCFGNMLKKNGTRYRTVANVEELSALYSDIDCYNIKLSVDDAYKRAKEKLKKSSLPEPSLVISSGRGLYLIWLLSERLGKDYLGSWNSAQAGICTILKDCGADSAAKDAARVLRIVGSVNTKSNSRVRVIGSSEKLYGLEDFSTAQMYTSYSDQEKERNLLKTEISHLTIDELNARAQKNDIVLVGGYGRDLANRRFQELIKLPNLLTGKKIPIGRRHNYCLLVINCLAELGLLKCWQREFSSLVECIEGDFPRKDIDSIEKTVLKRAKEQRAKDKGLYRFRPKTIRDMLGISQKWCIANGLHTLGSNYYLKGKANTAWKRIKRRREGMQTREEYENKVIDTHKRSVIIAMHEANYNQKQIAKRVGINQQRVSVIIKAILAEL